MGNVCMGGDAQDDYYSSRSVSSGSYHNNNNNNPSGQRLGGNHAPEHLTPQEMAARAAETRMKNNPVDERRKKEDIIGKLTEIYARRGQQAPIGLPTFTLEKLKELYDRERNK